MTTGSDPAHPHGLSAGRLLHGLDTQRVGRDVIVLDDVDSTNDYALDTLVGDARRSPDGMVVFAEQQTAGRGRLGRRWHSPRGAALLCTLLLRQDAALRKPARVMMATAIATVDAIETTTDIIPSIHWPNDVYVGHRKLAGVLVESRAAPCGERYLAIGIGLNCLQHAAHFPPAIRTIATSLELESADPIDRTVIAQALLRALDRLFAAPNTMDDAMLEQQWRRHSDDIGSRVTLVHAGEAFTGLVMDIHPVTGLLLQLDTGVRREFDPSTTMRLP